MQRFLIVFTIFLLFGCTDHVKSINFRVHDDQSVKTEILLSYDGIESDKSKYDPEKTRKSYQEAIESLDKLKSCMGGSYTFNHDTGRALFSLNHETFIQLEEAFACDKQISERIDLNMTKKESFFISETIFDINIQFPIKFDSRNSEKTMIVKMDDEITVNIENFENYVKIDQKVLSDNIIELKFHPNKKQQDFLEQKKLDLNIDCDKSENSKNPLCTENIELRFISTHQKYGMNEYLALFGILCGSGIAVSLASRVMAIRVKPSN